MPVITLNKILILKLNIPLDFSLPIFTVQLLDIC